MTPEQEIAAIRESARAQSVDLYGTVEREPDVLAQWIRLLRRGTSPGFLRLDPPHEVRPAKRRITPVDTIEGE